MYNLIKARVSYFWHTICRTEQNIELFMPFSTFVRMNTMGHGNLLCQVESVPVVERNKWKNRLFI